MSCTRSDLARGALLLFLAGCTTTAAPRLPRPAQPLPPELRALAAPVPPPTLVEQHEDGPGHSRGVLQGSGERVEFELWRAPGQRRPLVLLVPILAGGADLMASVGNRLAGYGFDVALAARAGSAMRPPQRGPELARLFERTVLHQRLLLAWQRAADGGPPPAVFALGISLGGIVTTAVAALEPGLSGAAICLSGGDLPDLVLASGEGRVQNWVRWRRDTDGIGTDGLRDELRRHLGLEPDALAAALDPRKILFVSARFDDVVPPRHQDLLWEALGRPERLVVPLGHYTTALAIGPIVSAVAAHFRDLTPGAAPPPP